MKKTDFMKTALRLAKKGLNKTGSNPMVGAVIVKNNKIIEGNPDMIKMANDVWKFSKNMWSQDPTWYLVETSNK